MGQLGANAQECWCCTVKVGHSKSTNAMPLTVRNFDGAIASLTMLCWCFGNRPPGPQPDVLHKAEQPPEAVYVAAKQESDADGRATVSTAPYCLLSSGQAQEPQRAMGDDLLQTTSASIQHASTSGVSGAPTFNLDNLISQLRASHSPLPVGITAKRSSVASVASSQIPTLRLPHTEFGTGELADVFTASASASGPDFSFDQKESLDGNTAPLFKQQRLEDSQRLRHTTIHEVRTGPGMPDATTCHGSPCKYAQARKHAACRMPVTITCLHDTHACRAQMMMLPPARAQMDHTRADWQMPPTQAACHLQQHSH